MKAVFIDRDGVLLEEPVDEVINSWEKFQLKPDLGELKKLVGLGYKFFIITNQEGIHEGRLEPSFYAATNDKLLAALSAEGVSIEGVYTCPHTSSEQCDCRKPQPKLINQIRATNDIQLEHSYLIGDRPSDVELASNVGLHSIFIKSRFALPAGVEPGFHAIDLRRAVTYIIEHEAASRQS